MLNPSPPGLENILSSSAVRHKRRVEARADPGPPSVHSPHFKNAFRHLSATALLSMEQCAFHAGRRWVEDDRAGRRHTRLFYDFSATGTGAKIARSRQWTSHGFAELEALQVFRQRPQRRNPVTGQFDEPRPKLLGACAQFWQLAKAKYAYLCMQAGLPIRSNKGKILYQAPQQTLDEARAKRGRRRPSAPLQERLHPFSLWGNRG